MIHNPYVYIKHVLIWDRSTDNFVKKNNRFQFILFHHVYFLSKETVELIKIVQWTFMGRRDGGRSENLGRREGGTNISFFDGTDFTSESAKISGGDKSPLPSPNCAAPGIGYDEQAWLVSLQLCTMYLCMSKLQRYFSAKTIHLFLSFMHIRFCLRLKFQVLNLNLRYESFITIQIWTYNQFFHSHQKSLEFLDCAALWEASTCTVCLLFSL